MFGKDLHLSLDFNWMYIVKTVVKNDRLAECDPSRPKNVHTLNDILEIYSLFCKSIKRFGME